MLSDPTTSNYVSMSLVKFLEVLNSLNHLQKDLKTEDWKKSDLLYRYAD